MFEKIISLLNIHKTIANHVVGKNHTVLHRRISGIIVMCIGVGIVKLSLILAEGAMIHYAFDIIGYAVHGIGMIPFVEEVESL